MGLLDYFKRKYSVTKMTDQKEKINDFLKNNYYVEINDLVKGGFKEVEENGETFLVKEQEIGEITETIVFKKYFLHSYFFKKNGKFNGWYCELHVRDIDFNYGVNDIVYGLTEGLIINDKKEGEWKYCLFCSGKKHKVEDIRNYKDNELDGIVEEYDTMGRTLVQGDLIFKTQYSKGKKHGKRIQYSTYNQFTGKKGFPVDIQYWEEDEFKYGTKFDPLRGKKLTDYYELEY